jgi:hypothetical protein
LVFLKESEDGHPGKETAQADDDFVLPSEEQVEVADDLEGIGYDTE